MFVSFFESAKYVGHLYPIALMRIYLGYYFLNSALERLGGDFLKQPKLAAMIMDNLPQRNMPGWYANFLQFVVVPNWRFFAYFVTYCELIIGVCFLIGLFVRPSSLLGILLTLNLIYIGGPNMTELQQTYLALFIVMFWVGAGRCFGLDYYFYKRQRGLWW